MHVLESISKHIVTLHNTFSKLNADKEMGLPSMSQDPAVAFESRHSAQRAWPPVCPPQSTFSPP